jgi:3-hydroxyisobutyrate dehydrogenase
MGALYFAELGILSHAVGKLFIKRATINPAIHVEIHKRGAELGAAVVEAPMASSVTHALEGKLFT